MRQYYQVGWCMKGQDRQDSWRPSLIDRWVGYLELSILKPVLGSRYRSFTLDLGYCLQYLEFLNHQLLEREPEHEEVRAQSIKTFTIFTVSVAERVFYYIILNQAVSQTKDWPKMRKILKSPNPFDSHRESEKARERGVQEDGRRPKDVRFGEMRLIVRKWKLLKVEPETYQLLQDLGTLRNRIHAYNDESQAKTDLEKFSDEEWNKSKRVLSSVLSAMQFDKAKIEIRDGDVAPDGFLLELLQKLDDSRPSKI